MTTIHQHTPLEVFLLVQSLRTGDAEASGFSKLSTTLKENEFVRESRSYEFERLDPDSLKRLYLDLLRDELRREKARSNSPAKDGDHNPRKRKLSTPPLETVAETSEQRHLLPKMANRLYATYKDQVIKAIEDEERKIRSLQKDIQEVENGEWDARLQAQETASRRESKGVSSIQTLLRDDVDEPTRDENTSRDRSDAPRSHSVTSHSYDSATHADLNGNLHHTSTNAELGSRHSRAPSLSGALRAYSPTHDSYSGLSRQPSQPRVDGHGTYLPPIGGAASSPNLDVSRRLPPPPPQMGAPSLTSPRLSNSPIILPPPPGMLRPSGSPVGPLDALADMAGQQYRSNPNVQSPRQGQFYSPQTHPNQLPQPRNYMQQSYPYYDSQVPYAQHYPPYGRSPLQPYQSPNQPQFQAQATPAPNYWSGSRQSGGPTYQSPTASYPQYSGYHSGHPGYQPGHQVTHPPPGQFSTAPLQATPLSSGNGKRPPHRPPPIDTSVSSTKWRRVDNTVSAEIPGSPSPPGPEAFSPISESAASPLPEASQVEATQARPKGQSSHLDSRLDHNSTPTRGKGSARGARGGRFRGNASRGRGARAASTASSAVAGSVRTRTRSQSLASHADDASVDNNRGSSRTVKAEPPATPVGAIEDSSTPGADTSRTSGRTRRDTIRSLETPQATNKRKRADTIEDTPEALTPIANARPDHILASRNFPRTSAPIMNDITTHKLASMFAKPLTEREAPGYKKLIYRPQDLKSIKSAINAGSRAIAALEDAGSPAIGNKGSSTLWVEKNSDVVPPKGIVNSAQLEKEVCRIFANAVMFSPDPKHGLGPAFRTRSKKLAKGEKFDDEEDLVEEDDGGGVVRDTREMFGAVEKSVGNWRAAERTGEDGRNRSRGGAAVQEEDEMETEPGDEGAGDEEGNITVKKRARR
ncbi:hypothetical protein MMC30_001176 [Trapelia coarctata]|nr:hypothetical protein [Trapelia coarctata]